jgi:putative acetyltransferase
MTVSVVIGIEIPDADDIQALFQVADAYYDTLYPPDRNHPVSAEALRQVQSFLLAARIDGELAGIGAMPFFDGYAEVKRMFVSVEFRGRGIGRKILFELHKLAAEQGVRCIRLETGIRQPEAIALYRSVGYVERGPFGPYEDSPASLYFERITTSD